MTTTAGMLFTGEETVNAGVDNCKARLTLVKARYDAYHADCQRRAAGDNYRDAARNLRNAACWLAGDFDRTYAGPHPSFGTTLQDFRVHYANDALRSALHFVLWAEHYAGLREIESVRAADPWNR